MDSKQYYYKVPFINKDNCNEKKLHIIGIIDCSGSMGSWWKWVAEFYNTSIPKDNCFTITFDTVAKVVPNNILSENINTHGGGGTNISLPFEIMEKHLEEIPKDHSITAIFISDGQDNNMNTLEQRMAKLKGNQYKKINFICLGIQKGFPTFLSMRLRNLYHKGDETIPAVYLIEYAGEKAFFNKFESMKNYFYSAGSVNIEPAVCVYPWDETVVESSYEGQWIICKNEILTIEGKTYDVSKKQLDVQDLVEILRGWTQSLQLTTLNDIKEAQKNAIIAIKEMNQLCASVSDKLLLDLTKINEEDIHNPALSFAQRAKVNYVFRYGSKINWFLKEVEQLSKGESPKFNNDFEAAKYMNIGTITGKYHQKQLALKDITGKEFQLIRNEFKEVHLKFAELLKQNQPPKEHKNEGETEEVKKEEVVAKEEQKIEDKKQKKDQQHYKSFIEILQEPDFLEGLDYCKSQFDLLEIFPLNGLACRLKRYEGSNENPWLIEMKFIPKHPVFIDLAQLTVQQFKIEQQITENQKEEITCILPLFRPDEGSRLKPFLSSRLFKFLTTYIVMQNVDCLCDDAYLSLLSSALSYLYTLDASEWRDKFCKLIYSSLKSVYGDNKNFNKYSQLLQENPVQALKPDEVTEEEAKKNEKKDQPVQQLDLMNPFVHIFYAWQEGLENKENLKNIFEKIYLIYFFQLLKKVNFFNIVKPEINLEKKEKMLVYYKEQLDTFFAISDFRKNFSKKFLEFLNSNELPITVFEKAFEDDNTATNISLQSLKNLYEAIIGQPMDKNEYLYFVFHAHIHGAACLEKPINRNYNEVKNFAVSKISEESIRTIAGFSEFFKEIEIEYTNRFTERHQQILPISSKKLKTICGERNIKFETLIFDPASGLCQNACMSPSCPFYLVAQERFKKHLDAWQGTRPGGFHRFVKARVNQEPEQIYEKAKQNWKGFPERYKSTKEFVIDYIKNTVQAYKEEN